VDLLSLRHFWTRPSTSSRAWVVPTGGWRRG